MRHLLLCLSCLTTLCFLCSFANAQATDSLYTAALRLVKSGANQSTKLDRKLEKAAAKALRKWERRQERLIRKVAAKDSATARLLSENYVRQKQEFEKAAAAGPLNAGQYIPSLDTLNTALKFLQKNAAGSLPTQADNKLLEGSAARLHNLKTSLYKSGKMEELMQSQQQLLRDKLASLDMLKELKSLNKTVYYYRAQLDEYKSLLKDHKRAARKALGILQKTKPFQDFMRRNSQLAYLFRLPADPNDPSQAASLSGLQTRAQVNNLIQQQISAGGAGGAAQLRSNISQAQSELNELKDKVLKLGGGGSDIAMPDGFKPNPYKTKSFLKRIELGANIQSQRARGWLPTRSDIGLSVGYKFNENIVAGMGGSYRVGWGENIRHMKITHQGISLRSFVDVKLKGSFWLTGGYEQNQVQTVSVDNNSTGKWAWRPSGLVGVSKVISMNNKFLKKTKVQLLWDFLQTKNKSTPGSPILFRIAYTR